MGQLSEPDDASNHRSADRRLHRAHDPSFLLQGAVKDCPLVAKGLPFVERNLQKVPLKQIHDIIAVRSSLLAACRCFSHPMV